MSSQASEPVGKDAVPKTAAAIILWRRVAGEPDEAREIYWARRSMKLAFLPGFHAFPGGAREAEDEVVEVVAIINGEANDSGVANAEAGDSRVMIACAARELFEETGVLIARGSNGEQVASAKRLSRIDEYHAGRLSFAALLRESDLHLDARDFVFAGQWVTPPFSPRRFDTLFYLVECPRGQEPFISADKPGELEAGGWTTATLAIQRWQASQILIAAPLLHILRTLAESWSDNSPELARRLLAVPEARGEQIRRIEFHPGVVCIPLRTPTIPPATHTNCYIIYGAREMVVIDPPSPDENEQDILAKCIDDLVGDGRRCVREIILTHDHPDHTGGVIALQNHLHKRHTTEAPIAAHRFTAEQLRGRLEVTRYIEDGDSIELESDVENDCQSSIILRVLHTPGHARGHLCFYNERTGALFTGDMVVGLGSILVDPSDGNMSEYIRSLERLHELPNLSVLFSAHGPPIGNPQAKIAAYIAHRLEREAYILEAVREGASTVAEIVKRAYTDVPTKAHPLAARASTLR